MKKETLREGGLINITKHKRVTHKKVSCLKSPTLRHHWSLL